LRYYDENKSIIGPGHESDRDRIVKRTRKTSFEQKSEI